MSGIKNFFLATRPNFLIITLLGCCIGLSFPSLGIKSSWIINLLAIFLAMFAHSGANLLNDYCDHRNGSDENNEERIAPYTGGSRYIQNQILSPRQIYLSALVLLGLAAILGLYICSVTTWELLPIGLVGICMAWGYSAPPLQLMSRGILGELAIAIAWSSLVVGMASLQIAKLAVSAIPVGLAFGLMISNILFVNQIPDINADKAAGKNTLAVQYKNKQIWVWQILILFSGFALQFMSIYDGTLPKYTLITLACVPGFAYCASILQTRANMKAQLKLAIQVNLLTVHLYAILLLTGIFL